MCVGSDCSVCVWAVMVVCVGGGDGKSNTVEPPNKGHFGSRHTVLYREAVLWWEVK